MIHGVTDTDTHFIIDGATRTVKNETETKSMLVQFDHNSERFTFKVPRYVDGHDLAKCNAVRAHYINIDKSKRTQNSGANEINDLCVCPDDQEFVMCSWLIPYDATQLAGSLHFVIQFACKNGDETLYSWNTAKHTGVTVADGISFGDIVVSENLDILTKWEKELKANHIVSVDQTTTSDADEGVNVWTATFGDGRTQDFKVKNGRRGATGRIGSIQTIQGNPLRFFVGTKKEYDALPDAEKTNNLLALFTDDKTREEFNTSIEEFAETVTSLSDRVKEIEQWHLFRSIDIDEILNKAIFQYDITISAKDSNYYNTVRAYEIRFQILTDYNHLVEYRGTKLVDFQNWLVNNYFSKHCTFIQAIGYLEGGDASIGVSDSKIVIGLSCEDTSNEENPRFEKELYLHCAWLVTDKGKQYVTKAKRRLLDIGDTNGGYLCDSASVDISIRRASPYAYYGGTYYK